MELIREYDLGDDDAPVLEATTHLGGLLQPGDMVEGYDLGQLVTHSDLVHEKALRSWLKKHRMPDVIVVRKHYEYNKRQQAQRRKWKVKTLKKEREYSVDQRQEDREEKNKELFMRDIEQDFDLRLQMKLYKDSKYVPPKDGDHGDVPQIPDEELIDELKEMTVNEQEPVHEVADNDHHHHDDDIDIELMEEDI